MYRKYYSYSDMPQIAKPDTNVCNSPKENLPQHIKKEAQQGISQNGKLFGKLENDDIILIVVVLILLADDCDDKLLLLALGFIFLSGMA